MSSISPKMQNQIAMLQQIQQQMQTVLSQKTQFDMAVREAKRAMEELKEIPEGGKVYMNIGTVMMQQTKEHVTEKLTEKAESLELRVKALEKQEKLLQQKFEQLQAQVKAAIEGKVPPAAE